MNRRSLFKGLFGGAALVAVPTAATSSEPWEGVWWTPRCPRVAQEYYYACGWVGQPQFIDLTKPLGVPNQCPRCMAVMDLQPLGEQIKAYHKNKGSRS